MHQDREMGGDKNTQIEDTRKDWNLTLQTTLDLHRKIFVAGVQTKRI